LVAFHIGDDGCDFGQFGMIPLLVLYRKRGILYPDVTPLFLNHEGTIICPCEARNSDSPCKKIAEFYKRWSINEFSLFGSVLREDLNPDSDIDVLVLPGNFAVILFGVIYGLMIGAPILGFLQGASRNWLLVSNLLLLIGFFNAPLISAVLPCRAARNLPLHWRMPSPRTDDPRTAPPHQ
jgi:hypothetical protein